MEFLDKRIKIIADELKKLSIRDFVDINPWKMKEGFFTTCEEAENSDSPWVAFDSTRDMWKGNDKYFWFQTEFTVPDSFQGKWLQLKVASQIDSRTILDSSGAEKLLGKGDMLYLPMGENTPLRIQGCFISDDEINRLINYCAKQINVKYDEELSNPTIISSSSGSGSGEDEYDDPQYNEVVEFAINNGKISASLIQRKFRFGYNRAARVMDLLEARGIVGPQNGSKPREVLVKLEKNDSDDE